MLNLINFNYRMFVNQISFKTNCLPAFVLNKLFNIQNRMKTHKLITEGTGNKQHNGMIINTT